MGLIGKVITGVVAVLILIVAVLWFYGNPPAATPSNTQGWSHEDKSRSYGILTVHQHEYSPGGSPLGGAIVATFGDFPVVDEGQYVPGILQDVAQKNGITLTKTGTQSVNMGNLRLSVPGTFYDAEKDGLQGRAMTVDFPCPTGDGYVVGVAFGGAAGTISPTFPDARSIVQSITCG